MSNEIKQKRLTDKQRKQVIADYLECQNYSEVARKYHISSQAIAKIVKKDKDSYKKLKEKKEENTVDVIKQMKSRSGKVVNLLDNLLEGMNKKSKKIDDFTTIRDLSTAYGTVFDKQLKLTEIELRQKELALREKEIDQQKELGSSAIEDLSTLADLLGFKK